MFFPRVWVRRDWIYIKIVSVCSYPCLVNFIRWNLIFSSKFLLLHFALSDPFYLNIFNVFLLFVGVELNVNKDLHYIFPQLLNTKKNIYSWLNNWWKFFFSVLKFLIILSFLLTSRKNNFFLPKSIECLQTLKCVFTSRGEYVLFRVH